MDKKKDAIDPRRWTVVCKHWLKDLCMKDDNCEYLHQMDLSRMPVCPTITKGRICAAEDCIFKHVDPSQKRCEKYDYGCCKNGPNCRERHERATKPPEYIPDRLFAEFINPIYHNQFPMKTDHLFREAWEVPFQGNTRYFIAKGSENTVDRTLSSNLWAAQSSAHSVLKEALRQVDNVALILMDQNFLYGFAKVLGKSEGSESSFRIKFIKKTKLKLDHINNYRNPYDGNILVRMGRNSQEIDPAIAEKICSLILQEEFKPTKRERER